MRARRAALVTVRAHCVWDGATSLPHGLLQPGGPRPTPSSFGAHSASLSASQTYKGACNTLLSASVSTLGSSLVEIDRSVEPSAEPASDGCPGLAIAIFADQSVAFRGVVQLVLDLVLLEGVSGYPAPQCPCSVVECCIPPTRRGCSQVRDNLSHVGLAAAAIATHRPTVASTSRPRLAR